MNARQLFRDVVSPNYYEFFRYRSDIRLLWNAVISMNSVADYLAVEQLGYRNASRQELTDVADKIVNNMVLKTSTLCRHTQALEKDRG